MLFASYNIQYGTGKDGRVDLGRIADAVGAADVIALQEVERHWPRTGDIDQVAALASLLPDRYWVYGPGLDMHAEGGGPAGNRRRQFGNMLLSRVPIVSSRHHMLPKFGATKQYCLQRSAIEGVIETPSAGPLRVYSVHLSHLGDGDRAAQVDRLLAIHRDAPAEGGAWCGQREGTDWTLGLPEPPMPAAAVFMGDFNLAADSPLYERLAEPLSNEYGRMTARAGLVDAWVAAGNPEDTGTTADSHVGRRFARIDYCFASAALAPRIRKAWIDGRAVGSDHQPVWTEFEF
jgi:endonuclease/exonuclease/phosphatase family metal-dependent hydrolase